MDASYRAFHSESDNEEEVPPHGSIVRIHVPPASKVTRWSHIEDLDSFFSRIYAYHQKHGFTCICLSGSFDLLKVIFVLVFCVFLLYFIDYDILFHNKLPPNFNTSTFQRVTWGDVVCPSDQCFGRITGFAWLCIIIVLVYCLFLLVKLIYNLYHFWDIKQFFNVALEIPDNQLDNITWHNVELKMCEVQREYQMCIRKTILTELDIYHRILRSKNYMVSMVNKSVLPVHYSIPLIGDARYMSQGLKYNIEVLLFSEPWGLFENWNLKEDYKKATKRHELSRKLQIKICWLAFVNLVLGFFIFVWQLVYFFFIYAEVLKREPGTLGLRMWSSYARLYLRHLNELDHELDARLRRAYRPATKYVNTFSSPVMTIIAENTTFFASAVFGTLLVLTIWDEEVLQIEHTLLVLSVLGIIIALCKSFVPDENMCLSQEDLLVSILKEVHYLPDTWRGKAHTTDVLKEFEHFFQFKAIYLLTELFSPLTTPFILFFKLRPRSLDVIDFFRNFTVNVMGVGDVCSFSLMDTRKHGNPTWQRINGQTKFPEYNQQMQAEDGKTELSLVHFAAMNPTWNSPPDSEQFLLQVKEQSRLHAEAQEYGPHSDPHSNALESASLELSMIIPQHPNQHSMSSKNLVHSCILEGPAVTTYYNPMFRNEDAQNETKELPVAAVDMSLSTLYLHSLHHRNNLLHSATGDQLPNVNQPSINSYVGPSTSSNLGIRNDAYEDTPLLKDVVKPS